MYMKDSLKKVWHYTGKKNLILNLSLLIISAIFEQIYLVYFSELINRLIGFEFSFYIIGLALLFIIINSILNFFIKISLNLCRIDFIKNVKEKFFASILLSTDNKKDCFTDITTRNSENINNLSYLYDGVYSNVFRCFTRIFVAFIIIARINIIVAILSILIPVSYNLIFILNGKILHRLQSAEWKRNNRSNEFFDEINESIISLQGLKSQKQLAKRVDYLLKNCQNIKIILARFWARVSAGDSLLTQVFPIFLITLMILFSHNHNKENIGNIYSILYNIPIFLSFVWDFDINAFNRFHFSLSKIEEYFIPLTNTTKFKNHQTFKNLEFYNVSVRKNDKYILKNINFTIQKNDKVLIYGPSGSGKSTIINIILRTLRDFEGNVLLNGKKINELDICDIYSLLSYSCENNYFFTGTVYKNLILTNDNKSVNQITKTKLIKDKLFDNKINESFSAGEKGYISFLNTINSKKELLIFDETCANLDIKNLHKVTNYIENIKDKTIIFVSHNQEIISNKSVFTKIINLGDFYE